MPVELNLTDTAVILESASEPGPAGPGVAAGGTVGQVLTKDSSTDYDTSWQDATGGGGGSAAEDITFTPAGTIAATDTQAAVEEVASDADSALTTHSADTTAVHGITDTSALALTANVQPIDSDLTAIAALTTTSFGRGLLELANQAALLSAAGAAASSHTHAQSDITSLVTDLAGKQPLDSDLTAIAALTTTAYGRALLTQADEAAFKATVNLEAGTDFPSLSTFNDHSARHENGGGDVISIAGLAGTPTELTNHLNDTSAAHAASAISFSPTGTVSATDVQAALAEVASEAGSVWTTALSFDGSSLTGTVQVDGSWSVVSSTIQTSGGGPNRLRLDTPVDPYVRGMLLIRAEVKIASSGIGANAGAGILHSWSGTGAGAPTLQMFVQSSGAGAKNFRSEADATAAIVGPITPSPTWALDAWSTVEVVAVGASATGSLDGQAAMFYQCGTNTSWSSLYVGLIALGCQANFRNISVRYVPLP